MNLGGLKKAIYSTTPSVMALVVKSTQEWPHGFSRYVTNPEDVADDEWFVEIENHSEIQSVMSVIDAYMHIGTGISCVDIDDQEIKYWLSCGSSYHTMPIKAPQKELPYELWKTLLDYQQVLEHERKKIKCIILTVMGKVVPLDEISFYSAIVSHLNIDLLLNNCFFEYEDTTYLRLHMTLRTVIV